MVSAGLDSVPFLISRDTETVHELLAGKNADFTELTILHHHPQDSATL